MLSSETLDDYQRLTQSTGFVELPDRTIIRMLEGSPLIEVVGYTGEPRRAEDGTRAWMAEPGEYYQAFDGEYGGLWRRNGRPPQQIAGVG